MMSCLINKCLPLVLLILFFVGYSYSARILGYFPIPSVSHQIVFRPLMLELNRRGHDVVVLTTDPIFEKGKSPKNFMEIDVHDLSYDRWNSFFVHHVDGKTTNSELMAIALGEIINIVDEQLNTKEVKDLINSKDKFDLVFIEANVRSLLIMSHVFKAPLIQFSSFGALYPNYQTQGSPAHPLIYPEVVRKRLFNLTIWEKLQALYNEIEFRQLSLSLVTKENAIIKKHFGPDAPTVDELRDKVAMLFLNENPIFEYNRPVPPGVIHLGGLHQKPPKELPADLKSFLDSSKHGVIYISFGTNVNTTQLPSEKVKVFCRVFSKLPYDVLWKWSGDDLVGRPKNVRIAKWLPQSDLLRHPKIKLYIMQGGLQSTDEAITAGVPMITFPMLGDQWFNAEQHVRLGIGIKLELSEVSDEILDDSIKKMINDPSYRKNIAELRDVMNDQPQSPLERAVWWTEYVLRHGGSRHLRAHMADVTWTQYLMLDVVAVLLSITLLILFILYRIVKILSKVFNPVKKLKRH